MTVAFVGPSIPLRSSPSSALSCNIDAFGTKCFEEPLSRVIFHRGVRRFSFAFIVSSRSHSTRHLTPSYNRLQTRLVLFSFPGTHIRLCCISASSLSCPCLAVHERYSIR
eukprot:g22061.t1